MRSFLVGCLACALLCTSCVLETTDMGSPNNNAPYSDITGKLQGWGAGGNINPAGTLSPVPGGRKQISLQAELSPACVFTVQFTYNPLRSDSLTLNIPVAVISYAVNGVTVRRKISVYDGASISGPGQAVEVVAFDESTPDNDAAAPYYVGITVTPGTRGGFDIPTLQNTPSQRVSAGSTTAYPIEPNTGAVLAKFDIGPDTLTDTLDFTKYAVQFQDAFGVILASVQDPRDWIPIPPGTTVAEFRSNDAKDANVRLVLGIDG